MNYSCTVFFSVSLSGLDIRQFYYYQYFSTSPETRWPSHTSTQQSQCPRQVIYRVVLSLSRQSKSVVVTVGVLSDRIK